MRGSPFIQTMLIIVAFVLAGLPVWRLTRPGVAAVTSGNPTGAENGPVLTDSPAADGTKMPVDVEAVFAPAPTDFVIQNLGETVLAGNGPQARFTGNWTVALPPEGVDLVFRAHWPERSAVDAPAGAILSGTNPAAAKITVRFVDGRQVEKSFWAAANGALAEVFTVPGAPPVPAAP